MLINNINNENKHKHHEKSEFGLSLSFGSKTLRRFSRQPLFVLYYPGDMPPWYPIFGHVQKTIWKFQVEQFLRKSPQTSIILDID